MASCRALHKKLAAVSSKAYGEQPDSFHRVPAGTPKRIEPSRYSQTAALWMGAELLDAPIQHLFALKLHDFSAEGLGSLMLRT